MLISGDYVYQLYNFIGINIGKILISNEKKGIGTVTKNDFALGVSDETALD